MKNEQDRTILIERIRQLPDEIEALVNGLTPAQLTAHFLAGEWSVAQNIHHLADSHMNSYVRCKLIATEDNPTFRPYDQESWAELPDAKTAELSVSMALLRSLHLRWVLFWESLSEAEWQRTGIHPDDSMVTLAQQLQLYAEHGEAHIDQITRTLAAQ